MKNKRFLQTVLVAASAAAPLVASFTATPVAAEFIPLPVRQPVSGVNSAAGTVDGRDGTFADSPSGPINARLVWGLQVFIR